MTKAKWLTALLLLCIPAFSQKLPNAPSAAIKSEQVIDKKFIVVMAFEAAAKSADFYTTSRCQAAGCTETDPLFGRHPSDTRLVVENVGIFAADVALAYELKKQHDWLPGDKYIRKFWWMPAAFWTVEHTRLARNNSKLY